VQAYLAHLRDAGFAGAPLPLGVDEQGREVLSFVAGDVPRNPLPAEAAGDEVLVALARLIRALHEASAGWTPPPDAVWGGTPATVGRPVTERTDAIRSGRDLGWRRGLRARAGQLPFRPIQRAVRLP
jgi:hypothetical protein